MRRAIIVAVGIAIIFGIARSPRKNGSPMVATVFFTPSPKAERAVLSAYGAENLKGKYGIRIETEPLTFIDPTFDRELEPDILLEYLSLPSIDPAKIENTRFSPSQKSGYEGSFYFLGQHNWVDLKDIRFLDASGNSVFAEYDLVIHLPTSPPSKYPITLQANTEIKSGRQQLKPPRSFDGLGVLVQEKEDSWKGSATYDGNSVGIEISADDKSFEEIAAYARSVIGEATLPRSQMNKEISEGLGFLTDKFKSFNVSVEFKADEFVPREFYFYKRRHHDHPELIIGLKHPADTGHWSLTFYDLDSGHLVWVPKM